MFSLSFQNVSNIPTASFLTQFFDQRLNKFRTLNRPRRRSCKFIKSYNFLLSKLKKKLCHCLNYTYLMNSPGSSSKVVSSIRPTEVWRAAKQC